MILLTMEIPHKDPFQELRQLCKHHQERRSFWEDDFSYLSKADMKYMRLHIRKAFIGIFCRVKYL